MSVKDSTINWSGYNSVARHTDICNELHALYARKNADYGDSFHLLYLQEGVAASRIRLGDKYNRFVALTRIGQEAQVKDENIRDTLLDLANYAIMTIIEMDREANTEVGYHEVTREEIEAANNAVNHLPDKLAALLKSKIVFSNLKEEDDDGVLEIDLVKDDPEELEVRERMRESARRRRELTIKKLSGEFMKGGSRWCKGKRDCK